MRIYVISLVTSVILIGALKSTSSAQVNIALNDVARIHLIDRGGGLMGSYSNDYEVVREGNEWKSYQTHERYSNITYQGLKERDSTEHRFIKTVPDDAIDIFLRSLMVVKSKFNPSDLKLSIPTLTKQIDSAYLTRVDDKSRQIFHSFFDTPAKLYPLLEALQKDYWTDDGPYASIEIITNKGDAIKMSTHRQVDYMLPWTINNLPTYNININHFFITATNLTDHRMGGKYLIRNLYSKIDYGVARDALERLRMQELSPANYSYIQQHFNILKVNADNGATFFSMHPQKLNKHIVVNGTLNIKSKDKLIALTRFAEDTLNVFLNGRGFMIDSCLKKSGCTINFNNNIGQSSHHYFTMYHKKPDDYLKSFNLQSLQPFTIKLGDRTEDEWIKLPNGKFVLIAYVDNYAVGVSQKYITKYNDQRRRFVFMIFSKDGKLLSQDN